MPKIKSGETTALSLKMATIPKLIKLQGKLMMAVVRRDLEYTFNGKYKSRILEEGWLFLILEVLILKTIFSYLANRTTS